jgi:hypothetical protein
VTTGDPATIVGAVRLLDTGRSTTAYMSSEPTQTECGPTEPLARKRQS